MRLVFGGRTGRVRACRLGRFRVPSWTRACTRHQLKLLPSNMSARQSISCFTPYKLHSVTLKKKLNSRRSDRGSRTRNRESMPPDSQYYFCALQSFPGSSFPLTHWLCNMLIEFQQASKPPCSPTTDRLTTS